MKGYSLPLLLVLSVGAIACGPTIQSGEFEVRKSWYEKTSEDIKTRATFEMSCPKESLTTTVLAKDGSIMGVEGCQKRLVYIRDPKTLQWYLNSNSSPSPQPASQPTSQPTP